LTASITETNRAVEIISIAKTRNYVENLGAHSTSLKSKILSFGGQSLATYNF
jgi:hypothetical protein